MRANKGQNPVSHLDQTRPHTCKSDADVGVCVNSRPYAVRKFLKPKPIVAIAPLKSVRDIVILAIFGLLVALPLNM